MTTTYSTATITIGGKAFDLADVAMAGRRPSIDFTQPSVSLAFEAVMPAPPDIGRLWRDMAAPMVDMHLPAGILGHVAVRGFVAGSTTRGDAAGTTVEMDMSVGENALRRALSMAVQRAIVERSARVGVIARCVLGDDPRRARYALGVLRRHGERRKRRAMRRLLRAARLTYSTTPSTNADGATCSHR